MSEITTKLSADSSEYRSVLQEAERFTGGIVGQIEHHFSSTRLVAHAVATALGLNFEEIAKGLARMITGVSEEEEASLKELATLSDELREKTIAAMHEEKTLQQQYNLALVERASINKKLRDNQGDTTKEQVEAKKAQLELLAKDKEIAEINRKMHEQDRQFNKEQNDDVAEAGEMEKKKRAEVTKATLEGLNKSSDLDEKISEQKTATLSLEDQLIVRNREKAELEATQKTTVKGSNDYKELQIKLNEKNNEITKLGVQIAAKGTTELIEQSDIVKSMIDQWTGFVVTISGKGRGNSQLTDAELQRKIASVQRDIFGREVSNRSAAGGAYYDPSAPGSDGLLEAQRQALLQAQNEQRLRADVRRNASAFGSDAAFQQYSGLTEQRFKAILAGGPGDATQQLVATMNELNQRLRKGIVTIPLPGQDGNLLQTGTG